MICDFSVHFMGRTPKWWENMAVELYSMKERKQIQKQRRVRDKILRI